MTLSPGNYMEWFPFVFIFAGLVLALIAPFLKSANQRHKRTQLLLGTFKSSLHEHDMEHWKEVYHGTREGAPAGHYISGIGKSVPLVSMWASGNDDYTAIQRMAESLEAVSADMLIHSVDIKMIWTEIGQLMEAMHGWLEDIPGVKQDSTFLEEQYPFLLQVFEKYGYRFKKWPYRVYATR